MRKFSDRFSAVVAVVAALSLAAPAIAAEPVVINGTAVIQGKGEVFRSGVNKGTFVGAFTGRLSVERKIGPLHGAEFLCPTMMVTDLAINQQSASGQCAITVEGGQIFGEWSCRGINMVGCDGNLVLTGGTGAMAGISGAGHINVRTVDRGVGRSASNEKSASMFDRGDLTLQGFHYLIPPK